MNEKIRTTRAWGSWEVLHKGAGYKVKKLYIHPGESISTQSHNHRSEHWTIVQGNGKIRIGAKIYDVKSGDSVIIPIKEIHKITNTDKKEELVIIEVQLGEKTEEEDIIRY